MTDTATAMTLAEMQSSNDAIASRIEAIQTVLNDKLAEGPAAAVAHLPEALEDAIGLRRTQIDVDVDLSAGLHRLPDFDAAAAHGRLNAIAADIGQLKVGRPGAGAVVEHAPTLGEVLPRQ